MSDEKHSGGGNNAAAGAAVLAIKNPAILIPVVAVVVAGMVITLVLGLVVLSDEDEQPPDAGDCSLVGISASGEDIAVEAIGSWSGVQLVNAATIAGVAAERGYDARLSAVAIDVAMVESGLRNLANDGSFSHPGTARAANVMSVAAWKNEGRPLAMQSLDLPHDGTGSDWDSVGLFQQRPMAGWAGGDVSVLMDPVSAAGEFFDAMENVPGWQGMDAPVLAQTIQRSAFPGRYAMYWQEAKDVAAAVAGLSMVTCHQGSGALVAGTGFTLPLPAGSYGKTSSFGERRAGYTHMGDDLPAPAGTAIYAVADGTVIRSSCRPWKGRSPCNIQLDHGTDQQGHRITTLYVHMYPQGVHVAVGDVVSAGDHIADVGSNGNSTGPHLHLEVWVDSTPQSAIRYLTAAGVDI